MLVVATAAGWGLVIVPLPAAAQPQCVAGLHDNSLQAGQCERMRRIARGNLHAAGRVLKGTGLDLARLHSGGQGGPFVPAARGGDDIARWERVERALKVLPLGAPLRIYAVSSRFGRRLDPINRRRAMHEGIDLVAPLRTPVQATGAGRVSFAGSRAGYGRTVEIDHGFGVRTRYAHLAATRVRTGQRVAVGQRIGLLGGSGRSTGPHLHYEILVDGRPRNPTGFIRAGQHFRVGE